MLRIPAERRLAVVVVTFNSDGVLGECLDSLATALKDLPPAEVIVVDNGSSDESVAVARSRDFVTVLETGQNLGYAGAINAACVTVPGADVLVLNPDVRLAPGSVAALQQTLRIPGTGIAVPVLTDAAGLLQWSLRREPTLRRALGDSLLGPRRSGRVSPLGEMVVDREAYRATTRADWATGAAWLISAECRDAVGDWDDEYFLYSEETDFALRARDRGFDLRLSPDAWAVHLGGAAPVSQVLWALLTVNRVRLVSRRRGRAAGALFRAVVLLGELLRAPRSAVRRAGARALLTPRRRVLAAVRGTGPGKEQEPGWLCFSAQDWWYHNQAHSDFQLMRRVAETRTVLLVNSIGLRMPMPGRSTQVLRRIGRKVRSTSKLVRRPVPDLPRFHVMTPVVLPFYGSPLLRRINAWSIRAQVRLVSALLRMPPRPVVVCTIPTAWDVVRPLPRRSLLYNRSDRHSDFPESDQRTIAALERALLEQADQVLYVSRSLMAEEAALTGARARFLDHGVDIAHFSRPGTLEPADLASIPHPRVGFFGGLDHFLVDFDLLERVAVECPTAQLVLVGDTSRSMDQLTRHPNVHWLGYRPYEQVPSYGAGFDVALMPWLDNEWIARCNPIKLKEYLALGLPVVSSDFGEVRRYADTIRIAADNDDFVRLVALTLQDGGPASPAERRKRVASASWDARAAELVGIGEHPGRSS